jgi:Resolvase, N terminal domain
VSKGCYRSDQRYVPAVDLGHARVSTAKQDLDRQLHALDAVGIPAERTFVDKKSGSAAIEAARTDPDAARQMLAWLTIGCHTLDRFEEERAYLFGLGIPADFLPSARELGRVDLI